MKDEYLCLASSIFLVFSSICAFISFLSLETNEDQAIVLSSWINSGSFSVDWSVQYNLLSSSMVLMVNFVSTLIHIYSVGYMAKDDRKVVFMGYLGLFTFFMLFFCKLWKIIFYLIIINWNLFSLTKESTYIVKPSKNTRNIIFFHLKYFYFWKKLNHEKIIFNFCINLRIFSFVLCY